MSLHRGAPANNGMHPTANSVALMRETPAHQRYAAAGDAERYTGIAYEVQYPQVRRT